MFRVVGTSLRNRPQQQINGDGLARRSIIIGRTRRIRPFLETSRLQGDIAIRCWHRAPKPSSVLWRKKLEKDEDVLFPTAEVCREGKFVNSLPKNTSLSLEASRYGSVWRRNFSCRINHLSFIPQVGSSSATTLMSPSYSRTILPHPWLSNGFALPSSRLISKSIMPPRQQQQKCVRFMSSQPTKTSSPASGSGGSGSTRQSRFERIRAYMNSVTGLSTEDLMAVSSGLLVVGALVTGPVIYFMRTSESTFEGLDTDDQVLDMVRILNKENHTDDEMSLETLLTDFLSSESVQHSAVKFVVQVLESQQVKEALQRLVKQLWNDLVADPETISQVVHLLQIAIQDDAIKAAVQKLVIDVIDDREVLEELVHLLRKLGRDQEVLAATEALLAESAHNTLNNQEILDHSMEFATDVVDDDFVQQSAGQALRNTLTYAIRPAIVIGLASAGAGFLLFSVLSLGYSRSSEQDAKVLDQALFGLQRSLQSSALWSIIRAPIRAAASTITTSLHVMWSPVRFVQSSMLWIGYTGKASVRAVNQVVTLSVQSLGNRIDSTVVRPFLGFWAWSTRFLGTSLEGTERIARRVVERSEDISYWLTRNVYEVVRMRRSLFSFLSTVSSPVVAWMVFASKGTIRLGKVVVQKSMDGVEVVYALFQGILSREGTEPNQ